MATKSILATVIRTEMCGGGTAYDVYFRVKDKPSRPLHGGHIYATVILRGGEEYYRVVDAIDPQSRWGMELGMEKYDAHKVLEAKAKRLEVRIAKRAFPELRNHRTLPTLWAGWTLPSAEIEVPVRLTLPV